MSCHGKLNQPKNKSSWVAINDYQQSSGVEQVLPYYLIKRAAWQYLRKNVCTCNFSFFEALF